MGADDPFAAEGTSEAAGILEQVGGAAAEQPIPPRYWWLKRLTAAGVAFALLVLGVRLWWGHHAEQRLNGLIAAARAAGQPVLIEDFARPPVPDSENAAPLLDRAEAALARLRFEPESALSSDESVRSAIAQFVGDSAAAWPLIRAARERPTADWGVRFKSPIINMAILPQAAPLRRLARASEIAARHEHLVGNDLEALEHVRDTLATSRSTGALLPSTLTYLTRLAQDRLATRALEDIAPTLALAEHEAAPVHVKPARSDQVRALIGELLDDTGLRQDFMRAMLAERLSVLDTTGLFARGSAPWIAPVSSAFVSLGARPMWQLDTTRLFEFLNAWIEAADAPDYPTARTRVAGPFDTGRRISRLLSGMLRPPLDGICLIHFRAMADRRMAACALAIRLFEVEHGRRPNALAELVPNYLPGVPGDPFDPAGGPLRYRPDLETPLLYSLDENGIDDGGRQTVSFSGIEGDHLFFLNGDRPRPRAVREDASMDSGQTLPDQVQQASAAPDREQRKDETRQPEVE